VLGIKRNAWTKVLPFATIFMAYVPAIVFVGITVLVDDVLQRAPDVLPTYGQYYFYVSAAIVIFTAFVAPELLCPDRRNGMLGIYLASTLTRNTYLLAKAIAVGLVLAIVTLGPPLFMVIARTIAGSGPEGPGEVALLLGQAALSGILLGVLYAAISLAVSSLTSRKIAASAAIILLIFGSATVSTVMVESDASRFVFLLNLLNMPFELVQRIYDEGSVLGPAGAMSTAELVAGYLAWVVPAALIVWVRYRRVEITR
jgi:ABC-2 type transport system permease protein